MKITVITGSPRKHGNSLAMTEAFIKEAEKCGHTLQCSFNEHKRLPCLHDLLQDRQSLLIQQRVRQYRILNTRI